MKLEIDLNKLIKFGVPIEGYLTMFLIYTNNQEVLSNYAKKNSVKLEVIKLLKEKGYLEIPDTGVVNSLTMKPTNKFIEDFINDPILVGYEGLLIELRGTYPKKVKTETGERYLQPDPKLIRELYRKTIVKKGVIDLDLHKSILKVIKYEIWYRNKNNNLHYMVQLTRYLRNKNWENFMKESEKWDETALNEVSGAKII